MTLTVQAGLQPERREQLAYHVHAHLDVLLNGMPVKVPAGIGINIHDPAVKQFQSANGTGYGGIVLCDQPCISPLHTHDGSGILHTESAQIDHPNKLGQLFREWGVRLDPSCVGGYCRPAASILVVVDGQPYSGNPAEILLTDRKEIAIVIGSLPQQIPSLYNWP
jgi:hypothetical protein